MPKRTLSRLEIVYEVDFLLYFTFKAYSRHSGIRRNFGLDCLLHHWKKIGEEIITKIGRFKGGNFKDIFITTILQC
jgi:hypothetical protein